MQIIEGEQQWRMNVIWSFGEDGTYKMLLKGNATSSGATYKVEGNTVTVTFKDNSFQTLQVYDMYDDIEAYIGLYGSDGNLVKFYRIVRCPATEAEVKKMLMAQWKLEAEDEYFADIEYDESYVDFSKDGKEYRFRHYKDYLSSDDLYCKYAGKYICWSNVDVYDTNIIPDEKDLTKGKISRNRGSSGSNHFFSRTCAYSSKFLALLAGCQA